LGYKGLRQSLDGGTLIGADAIATLREQRGRCGSLVASLGDCAAAPLCQIRCVSELKSTQPAASILGEDTGGLNDPLLLNDGKGVWPRVLFDGRIISGITVFVAVARAESYGRAAEQIGLSRSGVGKAIGRLEERTGMRLFDRTSRHLKLTDEGRALLEEVTPLLAELGRIATPSRPDKVKGRIRITTDGAFGPYLLIPLLPRFLAEYPKVKVDVLVRDRVDNLLAEGVDLALRFGEPEARDLNKQLLLQSRVVTCASAEYIARHGTPAGPHDLLSGHTCVRMFDDTTGRPHLWHFVNAAGEQHVVAPDCGLTLNDAPSLVAAALNDFGIVRLLDVVASEHLRTGRLVEVLPEWNHLQWPGYLYTPAQAHQSHAIEAFKDFIRRCGEECEGTVACSSWT
jgi:DNA-binding transcriptional LysR family regulator